MPGNTQKLELLTALESKVRWLSSWMIHNANHIRASHDGLKVGGHQASSASSSTLLSALYFDVLRPQDRVAVKPHASPVFHAIQYLLGNQTREKLENFRGLEGAQSYPSRTKDTDDVDFSTGSVGLGVAQTLFASLVQDYVKAHGMMQDRPEGRMIAIVGDAELDEGNIHEALIEGWKHNVRNTWWVIDYNRQSLDAVVREDLWKKYESTFQNFGWDVVIIKYGKLMQAGFAEPGGEDFRNWIDDCPNQLYAALCFQGGGAFRKHILADIGSNADAAALINRRSDEDLLTLMSNLGGHDMASVLEAFHAIDHDRPVCFIAYTIKGIGLPFQGHKDNHAGLMSPTQIEAWRGRLGIREGHEWDKFEGLKVPHDGLAAFLYGVPFNATGPRRRTAPKITVPQTLECPLLSQMSTQQSFGLILNALARSTHAIADRIVTTSPDVTVSTNLGSWVNRRGLYARDAVADVFKREKIASSYAWDFSPKGQHIELGIAEMNLFLLLSALGLSHAINGERLIPIGTVYDPFVCRGLDAMNYACYQDARFMIAGTPAGVTLAPEGGAHQSIGTPLIGMSQPGLATFEPAYADELAAIMAWSFDYMQRDGQRDGQREGQRDGQRDGHGSSAQDTDAAGGSVYLRLSTRTIDQPKRDMTTDLAADIIAGAYWVRRPTASTQTVIAYAGTVAPEALDAMRQLDAAGHDCALLAVTSYDRLHAGWNAAARARRNGTTRAISHIENLLSPLNRDCNFVTVLDGHPATLAWLGSVRGHRITALGVEEFGQTGTIADVYRTHGLDAATLVSAAQAMNVDVRRDTQRLGALAS